MTQPTLLETAIREALRAYAYGVSAAETLCRIDRALIQTGRGHEIGRKGTQCPK